MLLSLWVSFLPPLFLHKDICHYIRTTWIIPDNLTVLIHLISNLNPLCSLYSPCQVTWDSHWFQRLSCGYLVLLVKNLPANAFKEGRSPGKGQGSPLQYSGLENLLDKEAWQTIVHSVAQSWTRLKQLSMHTTLKKGRGSILLNKPSCVHRIK